MKELIIKIKERHYKLFFQYLQTLDYVTIIRPSSASVKEEQIQRPYDFSDLAGALEWEGDAVTQQHSLRDE
ncbi:MAG: hypothetical protein IPJ00_12950 [Saprospirales bacterium]|nr:hypothetical protein [Saprospirales bacterium]MBK7337011.1 hypothetical protein [Saprospirales bacterium]